MFRPVANIWNSTTRTKLRPADLLQTIVALLFEKDSPCMVGLVIYIGNYNISIEGMSS